MSFDMYDEQNYLRNILYILLLSNNIVIVNNVASEDLKLHNRHDDGVT